MFIKFVPRFVFVSSPLSSSRPILNANFVRSFAAAPKAVGGGGGQAVGKKRFRLPVESDIQKLINYCCGANYYKSGEEEQIKPDSEYPDWLWTLPLKPPRLHEYDPATKAYWEKAKIVGRQREWKLRSITNKREMIVNKQIISDMELKYRRRFRALAKYHYNAGHEVIEHHEREDVDVMHEKARYALPEIEGPPFYPGIDQFTQRLPAKIEKRFSHIKGKIGHFGL